MKQKTTALFFSLLIVLSSSVSVTASESSQATDKTALSSPITAADPAARIRQLELAHTTVNGVDIAYKLLGDSDKPAVVMIMGLGASHMLWGDNLPYQLVDAGYQVVLFDNRDVGGSQRFDENGQPTIWWQLIKRQLGFEVDAEYDLTDMAADTVGLMDKLNIERAHIVGASMGGMIAQVVAAKYPQRSLSLVSIMSTSGFGPHLPAPDPESSNMLTDLATNENEAEAADRLEKRGMYPDAMPRQIMSVLKSGDRTEQVKTIKVPTLVLHGEDDTLIPIPHGRYTAKLISGSKFVSFAGMGHNMPESAMPGIVSNMLNHMGGGH